MTNELFAKLNAEIPVYAEFISKMAEDILHDRYDEYEYRFKIQATQRLISDLKKEDDRQLRLFAVKLDDILSDLEYLAADKTSRQARKISAGFSTKVEWSIDLFNKILMKGVV